MQYRMFGRTGWQVAEMGYGMWGMGDRHIGRSRARDPRRDRSHSDEDRGPAGPPGHMVKPGDPMGAHSSGRV